MALNFSESKKIPITAYLAKLGFEPAKVRGNDYWYRSPLRCEKDPSFKVNAKLNLWYDHGSGEGGTILDLGAKINCCSVKDFAESLAADQLNAGVIHTNTRPVHLDNKLEITTVHHLSDSGLLLYLKDRGISADVATSHCLEANFNIGKKEYKAVAFQNQSGGFELRNNWFKGSSSPKDVSYHNRDNHDLCLFEGFIDLLSYRQLEQKGFPRFEQSDILVLNSLSFVNKTIELLKVYQSVNLFLDNDSAGNKAKAHIESAGVRVKDQSRIYTAFKDVNEFLVASSHTLPRARGLKP